MQQKISAIVFYFIPIVVMIGLIPLIANDYVLKLIYILFTIALLFIKKEKNDWAALLLGLIGITISEYIFISTGVETFVRNSLFGIMPLWLPFLWAYAFVTIKRCLRILDQFAVDFIVHSCEQVLRFTRAENWNDLSEERKVQLGFNMGVTALGLGFTKEEGFIALTNAREGKISMQQFHDHLKVLIASRQIKMDEAKIARPF